MTATPEGHRPVMLSEVLEVLSPQQGDLIVDGTFGLGGHALALLTHADPCRLLGFERDPWILAQGAERLRREGPEAAARAEIIHGSHADLEDVLDDRGVRGFDAGLLDLGLNSLQIDESERGFRREDETLDLRFDPTDPMTVDAATLIDTWPETDLADALSELGGERLSRPIARALVRRRHEGRPVRSAQALAALVSGIYQRRGIRRQRIHPVTRTAQALRMAVNDELGHLARALTAFLRRLNVGGRLAVLTFHSGEARVVKRAFTAAVRGDHPDLPGETECEWIFRGVRKPSDAERRENPRARSAQLRALRRLA